MPAGPITHKGAKHTCPLKDPKPHVGGPVIGDCAAHTRVGPEGNPAARVGDQADCEVALNDTVRGGLITVWIDGAPAARQGDATDAGKIITGQATVELGARDPKEPVPRWVADWLFEYLANLKEEIPYDFTDDGCFARADRMAQYIEALDIHVEKLWIHALDKAQLAVLPKAIRGGTWDWHVAPIVPVQGVADPGVLVLDPTVHKDGPMEVGAWLGAVNRDNVPAVPWKTGADVYRCKFLGVKDKKAVWEPDAERDVDVTRKDLQKFRDRRGQARRAEGKPIGKPVHY
jgi:uncharacterized Zn-binding protein involved in type VI secretion